MIDNIKLKYKLLFKKIGYLILNYFPNEEIGWKIDLKSSFNISISLFFLFHLYGFTSIQIRRTFVLSDDAISKSPTDIFRSSTARLSIFCSTLNIFRIKKLCRCYTCNIIFLNLFLVSE